MSRINRIAALLLLLAPLSPAAAAGDDDWTVSWENGTRIESKDGDFAIKIGGRIQADFTTILSSDDVFVDDQGRDLFVDGSEFRRARLFVEGTIYGNIGFKAQYDFASGQAEFRDVWISFKETPVGEIKIGHFKEPFSLGALTSSKYITFIERSLPNIFAPGRNLGFGFSGGRERFNWGAGVFRESDNFGKSVGQDRTNLTGRVVWRPLYGDDGRRMFHLGLAATKKDRAGVSDEIRFSTRHEFHFSPRAVDTGSFTSNGEEILGLEAAGIRGPLWFAAEYIRPQVNVDPEPELDASGEQVELPGYYVQAGFFLTGESRAYSTSSGVWNRVRPTNRFGSGNGSGAWEVAIRYSHTDLTDSRIVGGELNGLTLALNWYPNSAVRMMFNFVQATLKDVGDVDAAVIRAQIDF